MKIGVFGTSNKENEKRLPVYPEHISFLSEKVKSLLYFEKGYGEGFGYPDTKLGVKRSSILSRERVFDECDILILPKPTIKDLLKMHAKRSTTV